MKHRARSSSLRLAIPALVAAGAILASGCSNSIGDDGGSGDGDGGGTAGAAGTAGTSGASGASGASGNSGTGGASGASGASGSSGVGGSVGGSAGAGGMDVGCVGTHVTTAKRLVRLTDNQLVNTYTALFGATTTATFTMSEDIPPATNRDFPPLATGGTSLAQGPWDLRDRMASKAMTYVGSNLATLTTCGATPTDANCAQTAVRAFAEKAYRRPLTADETGSLTMLWTELTATNGGSVGEAIGYSYYAILMAPEFLYRTEFGGDWNTDGALDQYELASELSYFLTDGPPDAMLLGAAAGNMLTDKEAIRAQATRILATPAARANLEAAMVAYFQLTTVPSIVIDPEQAPGIQVTAGLKNSMFREGELFMANTLWQGTLDDLVTSRKSWVNAQIAMPIYGVSVSSTDNTVFSEVMLPADRSGLLTLSPFLTSKTRPQGTSVVGRGLAVNAALVCSQNPAFPEDNTEVADAIAQQTNWDEKRKADFRADPNNGPCAGCHAQFDAMGLVLENYDAVGRHRTMDLMGNTIDTAWTTSKMPEAFDRDQTNDGIPDQVTVTTPAELAAELVREQANHGNSSPLARCMAMNFINYALADESQGSARAPLTAPHPTNSCAVRGVTNQFAMAPEKSFTTLMREIAASDTLALRSRGM